MKKVLLVVGLIVLLFNHSSFAEQKKVKGYSSGVDWYFTESSGNKDHDYVMITHKNPIDKKIRLETIKRLAWKPPSGYNVAKELGQYYADCFDANSKTYLNLDRCPEIKFNLSTRIKKEPENTERVKKFVNIIAKDVCKNPIIRFDKITKGTILIAGDVYFSIQCIKYASIHNGYLNSRMITFVLPEIISQGGYGRIEANDYKYEGDWNKDLSECKNCITTYPDNLEINGSFKIKEGYIYLYGDVSVRNKYDFIFNIYYDPLCNIKLPNKDYQNICSDIVSSEYKGVKFDIPLKDNTLEKTTEYTQTIGKKYEELQLLAQKETELENQKKEIEKQEEIALASEIALEEKITKIKKTCELIGYTDGTEKMADCILELFSKEVSDVQTTVSNSASSSDSDNKESELKRKQKEKELQLIEQQLEIAKKNLEQQKIIAEENEKQTKIERKREIDKLMEKSRCLMVKGDFTKC